VTAGPTRRLVLESAPLVAARAVSQPTAQAPAAAPHVQATGYTPSVAEARLPLPPVTHAQNDSLGSTICAHEQCAPPVDAAAAQAVATLAAAPRGSQALPAAPATASNAIPQEQASGAASSPRQQVAAPRAADPVTPAATPAKAAPAAVTPKPAPAPPPLRPAAAATTLKPASAPTPVKPAPAAATLKPAPAPTTVTAPTLAPAPPPPAPAQPAGKPRGMDVASYQGNVDWPAAFARGGRFVYVKATEGTGYVNPYFGQQYGGSHSAGLIRGAYHFALPDRSSGATQAGYFVARGGGWSADGTTLPPMLDIEYNPYGQVCYGMSQPAMSRWIADFSASVHQRTGRYPTIYTTRDWWQSCTGSASFGATNPLFLACYCSGPGRMPAGWGYESIWQYNDRGDLPGDQDLFNGTYADLRRLAL